MSVTPEPAANKSVAGWMILTGIWGLAWWATGSWVAAACTVLLVVGLATRIQPDAE